MLSEVVAGMMASLILVTSVAWRLKMMVSSATITIAWIPDQAREYRDHIESPAYAHGDINRNGVAK